MGHVENGKSVGAGFGFYGLLALFSPLFLIVKQITGQCKLGKRVYK